MGQALWCSDLNYHLGYSSHQCLRLNLLPRSFLLTCTLGDRRWWFKLLAPCYPHRKPKLNSQAQARWPSILAILGIWGKEPADGTSASQINKGKNNRAKENKYLKKHGEQHQETCHPGPWDIRVQDSSTKPARKKFSSKQDKRKNNTIIRFKHKVHLKVKLN